jgi:hypothetical protein
MSTVQPIVRSPTLTTMVRVSPSAGLASIPKSRRRLMIGMIDPRRLLTPSQYSGTYDLLDLLDPERVLLIVDLETDELR